MKKLFKFFDMNRRDFTKKIGFASLSVTIPQFISCSRKAVNDIKNYQGRNLVIIQWTGGNDGLNTVVPFNNDLYYKNRPTLNIPKNNVLKINSELGLNPVMKGFKKLYDEGLVTIVNNVGYPNPDRSHFRSMDIWHTASNSDEYLSTGWIGRYLDNLQENPRTVIEIDDTVELALKGANISAFATSNFNRLKHINNNKFLKEVVHHHHHEHEENVAYLYRTLIDTQNSASYLYEQTQLFNSQISYPKTGIGNDLQTIAKLIMADTDTKIYYVNLVGFDTHNNQEARQTKLLKQYSDAIKSFVEDLKLNNKLDDTLIMTFSEFGRRVKENASKGTDHGTANNVYFTGGKLKKPGIFNENPNLSDLDNGDLIYSVDFRKIYASILQDWLGVPPKSILNKDFKPLNLIQS